MSRPVVPASRLPRPLIRGTRGVVACGHPLGTSAGLDVIHAGGSAADAAVAAALVLCVVMPDACGIGGDAFAVVRTDAGLTAFNGSGRAPAEIRLPVPRDGGGTVAPPGLPAALADLHARHGRLPWDRVLAPAIDLAGHGFPLSGELLAIARVQRRRLERTAASWSLLDHRESGERWCQPELARLLTRIASDGPTALYRGEAAEQIAAAVRGDAGGLSPEDLWSHATVITDPVVRDRLGARIAAQPPVSQALLALTALGAWEASGLRGAAGTHGLIEALEGAFALRAEIGAVEDDIDVRPLADAPVSIDPERAAHRAGPRSDAHTTAVAAADADGTVVSMLVSVFDDFGSAVLVPELGIVMNDRLNGFTGGPNQAAPLRRPVHTLSPLMVETGESAFALCTPGADGQVQTLSQLLVAVLDEGATLTEALDRPRFRSIDGRIALEHDADPALVEALRARGHGVDLRTPGEGQFGAAVTAGIDLARGTLFAAADPRRETWAAGW